MNHMIVNCPNDAVPLQVQTGLGLVQITCPQCGCTFQVDTGLSRPYTPPVARELIFEQQNMDPANAPYGALIVVDGDEQNAVLFKLLGKVNVRIPLTQGEHDVCAILVKGDEAKGIIGTFRIGVNQNNWRGRVFLRRGAFKAKWCFELQEE